MAKNDAMLVGNPKTESSFSIKFNMEPVKVKDLIEALGLFDPNLEVFVDGMSGDRGILQIDLDRTQEIPVVLIEGDPSDMKSCCSGPNCVACGVG